MNARNIPARSSVSCAAGCIGDVCDTVGTQAACGGCCGCLERCQVKQVENQLRHPLLQAAAQERVRQRQMVGHTLDHDDEHRDDQLGCAAAAYAYPADGDLHTYWQGPDGEVELEILRTDLWPWGAETFKPCTVGQTDDHAKANLAGRQRELMKAVALLMAEWDRLERRRLAWLAVDTPVLVPRELCDGDQEIWYGGSGWYIQLWPGTGGAHGWWQARLRDDGLSAYAPAVGDTQREAVAALLRQVMSDQKADQLAMHFPDEMDVTADYLAQLAQEKLQQAPSRGYHPDQAVVEETTADER